MSEWGRLQDTLHDEFDRQGVTGVDVDKVIECIVNVRDFFPGLLAGHEAAASAPAPGQEEAVRLREGIANALAERDNPEGWTIPQWAYDEADSIIANARNGDEPDFSACCGNYLDSGECCAAVNGTAALATPPPPAPPEHWNCVLPIPHEGECRRAAPAAPPTEGDEQRRCWQILGPEPISQCALYNGHDGDHWFGEAVPAAPDEPQTSEQLAALDRALTASGFPSTLHPADPEEA